MLFSQREWYRTQWVLEVAPTRLFIKGLAKEKDDYVEVTVKRLKLDRQELQTF